MGLYNNIIVKDEKLICPVCKKEMDTDRKHGYWQSKDVMVNGLYIESLMQHIPLSDVSEGEMHGVCDRCGSFVELAIKDGKIISVSLR